MESPYKFSIEYQLQKNPAVGSTQVDDLCAIAEDIELAVTDKIFVDIIIRQFIKHMQKYYGVST